MLTQQQLEEIREADEHLGDDIRFNPEVYTHRRMLLELLKEIQEAPQQPAQQSRLGNNPLVTWVVENGGELSESINANGVPEIVLIVPRQFVTTAWAMVRHYVPAYIAVQVLGVS